jgi:hypothetical protein
LPGCSAERQAGTPAAPRLTSARYTLGGGESVALTPQMTLKLDRINDSRCKKAAVCVWEGHISYTFILSTKTGATPIVLSDSMPNATPTAVRQGLRFTLAGVEPATPPALDAPVPVYRVTLQVDVMPTTGRP